MKIFKIWPFSIAFSTNFLIFSEASGGSAPEPHTNPYIHNSLYFSLHFREILFKILKNFQKISKISLNFFLKIIKISLIFKHFLKIFEFEKTRNF